MRLVARHAVDHERAALGTVDADRAAATFDRVALIEAARLKLAHSL